MRIAPVMIIVTHTLLLFSGTAAADENPDVDFSERCSGPGVIWCIGFDDQAEVNDIGQVRYPAMSGAESIATDPQPYPDNVAPNGYLYPAVDNSQAASGAGSLRVTANPVGSANHSGGWYLGAAGKSPWPETFPSGETVYIQWRQRYDSAYTNQVDWGSVGGDGVKNIIIWRNESSCSDMEVTLVDSGSRGFPQAYTNCGGNPLYQCPNGYSADTCNQYNTDYPPKAGHRQFLYQYGPQRSDFDCMRNFENETDCGYYKNYHDRWWTYYLEITVGTPGQATSRIKAWMSRGMNEPMRQFIDYGPWPWSFRSGASIQNLLLTLYKTGKSSGDHVAATTWYDELIISSQPIPPPQASSFPCGSGGGHERPCPPTKLLAD